MTDVEDTPIFSVNQGQDHYEHETTVMEVYGLDLDAPGTAQIHAELGETQTGEIDPSNLNSSPLASATDYEGYFPTEGAVARFNFVEGSLISSINPSIELTPLSAPPSVTSDRFATVKKAVRITGTPMTAPASLLPSSPEDQHVVQSGWG